MEGLVSTEPTSSSSLYRVQVQEQEPKKGYTQGEFKEEAQVCKDQAATYKDSQQPGC